jgi:hypothetical protein
MNPQQQLVAYDQDLIAYTIFRPDVQIGQNLIKFVEYEVFNHDPNWIELREVSMQIKTGPRNGWYFSREDLEKNGTRQRVWHRLVDIAPFEIRPLDE